MATKPQSGNPSLCFAAIGKFNKDPLPGLVRIDDGPNSNSVSIFLSGAAAGAPQRTPDSDRTGIDGDSLNLPSGVRLTLTNAGTPAMRDLLNNNLSNGPCVFNPPQTVTVGNSPSYVMVGEFRSKGLWDIVVANAGSDNISLLQNQGDGHFVKGPTLSVGKQPVNIAVGNFFGNGRVDIAVANAGSNNISLLQNDGNGNFTLADTIDLGVKSPCSLAAGNFLSTTSPLDLAVAYGEEDIALLKNNGNGTFASPQTTPAIGFAVQYVALFTGTDGQLAVVNADFTQAAAISINQGQPQFTVSHAPAAMSQSQRAAGSPTSPPSIPICYPTDCHCTGMC